MKFCPSRPRMAGSDAVQCRDFLCALGKAVGCYGCGWHAGGIREEAWTDKEIRDDDLDYLAGSKRRAYRDVGVPDRARLQGSAVQVHPTTTTWRTGERRGVRTRLLRSIQRRHAKIRGHANAWGNESQGALWWLLAPPVLNLWSGNGL